MLRAAIRTVRAASCLCCCLLYFRALLSKSQDAYEPRCCSLCASVRSFQSETGLSAGFLALESRVLDAQRPPGRLCLTARLGAQNPLRMRAKPRDCRGLTGFLMLAAAISVAATPLLEPRYDHSALPGGTPAPPDEPIQRVKSYTVLIAIHGKPFLFLSHRPPLPALTPASEQALLAFSPCR